MILKLNIIDKKYNEIEVLKIRLNIPTVELVQTIEIHRVEKEKEQLLATMKKHRFEVKVKEKNVERGSPC